MPTTPTTIARNALALILLTASCGGGAEPIALEDYPMAGAAASCAKFYGCCTATELAAFRTIGDDEESCVVATLDILDYSVVQAAVEAGRLRFDEQVAGDCVAEFEATDCEDFAALLAMPLAGTGCRPAFSPLVEDGGACSSPVECIGGFCDGATSTELGTCRSWRQRGEICEIGQCEPPLVCPYTSGGGAVCEDATPRRANGETCPTPEGHAACESGFCNEDAVCAPRAPTCNGL